MKIETYEMVKEFTAHLNGCHYSLIIDDKSEVYIDYGCNHRIKLQIGAGKYLQGFLQDNNDVPVYLKNLSLLEDWHEVNYQLQKLIRCNCCGGLRYLTSEALIRLGKERIKNYR